LALLRDEIMRLAVAYQVDPLPTVIADLANVQDLAFRLLEGRQKPSDTGYLYLLAGAVSGMMANASHDFGNNQAAIAQARAAYLCADNAGHDALRAWVLGLQSMIAYWAGWPQRAIEYAQGGAEAAKGVTGTVSVWLPALEARAWAALGDAAGVKAAIEKAETARSGVELNDLDELGGKLTFPRPRQQYYAADAMIWLPGEEERAEALATDALLGYESAAPDERSYVDEAIARTDLVIARARRGELEGARAALEPVLDLEPAERIGGILVTAKRVHQELSGARYRGSVIAQQLQEELEAFCQVTAASGLPR